MKKKLSFFQTGKDIKKFIRSLTELALLVFFIYVIITAIITTTAYSPYLPQAAAQEDHGFIVVSYTGVERAINRRSTSIDNLDTQLKALYDSGYVAITQQNVIDYYNAGITLPDKALLLIFEDGNRSTTILAQKIMEKYNYKASILTFGDSFAKSDAKLLSGKDILTLEGNSFWETGSNGYRFHYINVFDRDDNYLGEMDAETFQELRKNIDNRYDLFLMDYIRDGMDIPKENYDEMAARIGRDYELMWKAYQKEIGKMPLLYALTNPNTGAFGHNSKVSAINQEWIYQLFKINLNRLGYAKNNRENSIYDLTRTQVQPYWHTNHLLMRIWADTGQEMAFSNGDAVKAAAWKELMGKGEYNEDEIILTTLPNANALLQLQESANYADVNLSVQLNGNRFGSQSLLLRMDESMENGIIFSIKDNILSVTERLNGQDNQLYTLNLYLFDQQEPPLRIEAGEPASRLVELTLAGQSLEIKLDGRDLEGPIELSAATAGFMGLGAETSAKVSDERKPVDNIYDGVFKNLTITEIGEENPLYTNRLQGLEIPLHKISFAWKSVTDWFIENL